MRTNEVIVVGLDATAEAGAALRWAVREARARGWSLHLVHGLAAPPVDAPDDGRDRAAADALLAEAAARAREDGIRGVRWTVTARPPGPVLIELSEGAALLVVGARAGGARLGRHGDSVGAHVSRFARCPVVVVPGESNQPTGRVAVNVRGDAADRSVLAFAFDQAAATRSELEVVHAWREPERGLDFSALAEDTEEQHQRASDVLVAEQLAGFATTHPDVPVRRVSLPADPRDALLWSSAQADLLVVAAPPAAIEPPGSELVEMIALRHSHCPVVFAR